MCRESVSPATSKRAGRYLRLIGCVDLNRARTLCAHAKSGSLARWLTTPILYSRERSPEAVFLRRTSVASFVTVPLREATDVTGLSSPENQDKYHN